MSSGLPSDALKAMGGIPVSVAAQEIIPSAERGVLDAVSGATRRPTSSWASTTSSSSTRCRACTRRSTSRTSSSMARRGGRCRPIFQAAIEVAMTASMLDSMVYFQSENGKALETLVKEKGVTLFDAPPDYAPAFIAASKKVLSKYESEDPFFKKVLESQRAFAQPVVPYSKEGAKLSQFIAGAADQK